MKTDGALNSLILMQADLRAGIDVHHRAASASLGLLTNGGRRRDRHVAGGGPSVVAREYWVGYGFLDDTLLVRAGRNQRSLRAAGWLSTHSMYAK